MFGRRGMGGRGPISMILSGLVSAIILGFILYIVYKVVIVGDGVSAGGVAEVFADVFEWGIGIGKSIADYIIEVVGGPSTDMAPGDVPVDIPADDTVSGGE